MKRRRRLPPNVSAFIDRHGHERFRWRKTGHKGVYLKEPPGTAANPSAEVKALAAGLPPPAGAERAAPGSVRDLLTRYYRDQDFTDTGPETRKVTRGILEAFGAEHGDKPVALIEPVHIEAILRAKGKKRKEGNRIVGGKSAAHHLRKHLIRLFDCAVREKLIGSNPARLSRRVKVPKGGLHTWNEEEIAAFRQRHKLGTKARLAMEILLWTWMRRGDAHLFGPGHLKGGRIQYTQAKTGKTLWLPAAPQLLAAIRAMPAVGTKAYLVTEFGKPFVKAGFGNWFRDRCDEAGLPQCSAHGLRKAGARRAAGVGATNQQLKAVGGWSNDDEVALYTAEADQASMAAEILRRVWEQWE